MINNKFKIFFVFLICLFILTGCSDNDSDSNDANIVDVESINVVSRAEKYDMGLFSGESENADDIYESDSKSIVDIVDESFSQNNSYIETNKLYSISFDLSQSVSLTSNIESNDSINEIVSVKINDEEVDYSVKNGKLLINWKTPNEASDADIDVTIEALKNGKMVFQTYKLKSKVNDKQYDIIISKTKAYTDKYTMEIYVKKNNDGSGGKPYLMLSESSKIIDEIELSEGINSLEFKDLLIGHKYEYIIVNKQAEDIINNSIYWGQIITLLPYQVTFENITSNSASIFLISKGSKVDLSTVYLIDGNLFNGHVVDEFDDFLGRNYYTFDNLQPNHNYTLKIDYIYRKDNNPCDSYFIKSFRTLGTDEDILRMSPNISNEVSLWPNGTKVEINASDYKKENIYLKKGSISCNEAGDVVTDGYYVKLTLPYDSFINSAITSSSNSVTFLRNAIITNGIDYYRLIVSSYTSSRASQSYYLKKGEYYIYTEDSGIFLYDLSIYAIMNKSDIPRIQDYSNDISYKVKEKEDNLTVQVVGKNYDFSNIEVEKYYGNDAKYFEIVDDFKIQLEDQNTLERDLIVSPEDIVEETDTRYKICNIIVDDVSIEFNANIKIYDKNTSFTIEYFDDYYSTGGVNFFLNDDLDLSGKGFVIYPVINHVVSYDFYKKIYFDNLDRLTEVYGLYDIDTSFEHKGTFEVWYRDELFGDLFGEEDREIGGIWDKIGYQVISISFEDDIEISSTKTDFIEKNDDLSNYAIIPVKFGEIKQELSFKKLKEFADKNTAGLSSVRIAYYINDSTKLLDLSEIETGTYNAVIVVNDKIVTNPIIINIEKATQIERYDGVAAKSESYDVWDITGEYLKVAANPNEGGEAAAGVQMRAFTSEATITSKEFDSANTATIIIMAGTNSSSKEARLLIELLDANGNPVEIAVLNGHSYGYEELDVDGNLSTVYPTGIYEIVSNNKITTKTVFDISTVTEFVKIRISHITCGANKKVAIVSIDAVVA